MSEIFRDVDEMGLIVTPQSMQNKDIRGNEDYHTKEVINYTYCLTSLRDKNNLFLTDKVSREWCIAEFKERIDLNNTNPGEAYKIRQHVWDEFLVDGKFDYSYSERIGNQAELVIDRLSKDPDSRQGIIQIWDSHIDRHMIGGVKRVPCSIYYQILIRDGRVHLIYNQRSADVVAHFGNDVYLAWKMKTYVTEQLNKKLGLNFGDENAYKIGFLYHNIASLHSYKKDWVKLKRTLAEFKQ